MGKNTETKREDFFDDHHYLLTFYCFWPLSLFSQQDCHSLKKDFNCHVNGSVVKNLLAKAGDPRDTGSVVKNLPAVQELKKMWVQSLGQKDPLEKGMAAHSSIIAWKIPWTGEPGGLTVHGVTKSQTQLSK